MWLYMGMYVRHTGFFFWNERRSRNCFQQQKIAAKCTNFGETKIESVNCDFSDKVFREWNIFWFPDLGYTWNIILWCVWNQPRFTNRRVTNPVALHTSGGDRQTRGETHQKINGQSRAYFWQFGTNARASRLMASCQHYCIRKMYGRQV